MNEIQEILNKHHHEYEILQWSLMNSIGTLIYSEFLSKMKKVEKPVLHFNIPSIKAIQEVLNHEGVLMETIAKNLVKMIRQDKLFYAIDDLGIFYPECEQDTNKVLLLYMLPNVERRIPESISLKFGLETEQQTFREDRTIDLFNRQFDQQWMADYIIHETVLQLITFQAPSNVIITVANTSCVGMGDKEIISISNQNALAPILIDKSMLSSESINLIGFVTNTSFEEDNDTTILTTSTNNKVIVMTL